MSKPELTEIDIYCIARLIQNSFQAPDQENIDTYRPFYGCMYCKYAMSVCNKPDAVNFKKVFEKLEKLTGVLISTCRPVNTVKLWDYFLSASHYLEHPEEIFYLEQIHDHDTVEEIRERLGKIITRSKEPGGQGQGTDLPAGSQESAHSS